MRPYLLTHQTHPTHHHPPTPHTRQGQTGGKTGAGSTSRQTSRHYNRNQDNKYLDTRCSHPLSSSQTPHKHPAPTGHHNPATPTPHNHPPTGRRSKGPSRRAGGISTGTDPQPKK